MAWIVFEMIIQQTQGPGIESRWTFDGQGCSFTLFVCFQPSGSELNPVRTNRSRLYGLNRISLYFCKYTLTVF